MNTNAYTLGFLNKLADYEKSALDEDTKRKREKRWAEEDRKRSGEPRKKYKPPKLTFREQVADIPNELKHDTASLLRGASGAIGIAATRGLQGVANYGAWAPLLVDSLFFGKLLGVDEGRGIAGRFKGRLDRKADRIVDEIRHKVSKNDKKQGNNAIGAWNKFLMGSAADVVGNAAGFGGIQSIGKQGLGKWFERAIAAGSGLSSLTPFERSYQLRAREALIDSLGPGARGFMDPTSTRANIENYPTLEERKMFHLPSTRIPTSVTGKIEVPYHWAHDEYENPLWFAQP